MVGNRVHQALLTRRTVVAGTNGAAMLTGVVGAACALPASGGGGTGRVPSGAVQISFLTDWAAGPRGQVIQEASKIWQQKYPAITLNQRIAASASAGPVLTQFGKK